MLDWPETWRSGLTRDVTRIYEEGLPTRVAPQTLPALAELAEQASTEAFDASEEYYALSIEHALHKAISKVAKTTALFQTGREAIRDGLTRLFGLTEDHNLALGTRRDDAGPFLGYPNGDEGVRKATRGKRPLSAAIIHEVVEQLIAIANDFEVGYERRFELAYTDRTPIDIVSGRKNFRNGNRAVQYGRLYVGLYEELRDLGTDGLVSAEGSEESSWRHPQLQLLAYEALGLEHDYKHYPYDAVETVLLWAIDRSVLAFVPEHENGLAALFGIGRFRALTLDERLKSLPEFMHAAGQSTLDHYGYELKTVRDTLLTLAGEIGYAGVSIMDHIAAQHAP